MNEKLLFFLHFFVCLWMTSVIWVVQILIYPLLGRISEADFKELHNFHQKRITWIVAPMMFLELCTGFFLLIIFKNYFFLTNFISILALWGWTFFVNIPDHSHFSFSSSLSKKKLVQRNWPRTLVWTMRVFVLSFFVFYKKW